MLDAIRLASTEDLDEIWGMLVEVCAQMPHDRYSPQWTLGVYPSKDGIMAAIAECTFYVGILDGRIVATMIVRQREDDEYANVPWPSRLDGAKVSTVHLVAVHPSLRGKGVGSELVREAIRLSRAWGKRAIHLDVMLGNLAASRIYLAEGFKHIGNSEVFYEDTGTVELEMYELVL